MEGKENIDKLVLPEPSHVGYVTRSIERTTKDLENFLGLEPFK